MKYINKYIINNDNGACPIAIVNILIIFFLISITSFAQPTFINPINQGGDPYVVKKDNYYYFIQSDNSGLLLWKSDKLTDMGIRRRIWNLNTTGWNCVDLWAPEIHYIDGDWYVYDTAGGDDDSWEDLRCGVLQCDSQDPLTGNWTDKGMVYTGTNYQNGITPTTANTEWAIDITHLKMNGQLYGIWSGWENSTPNANGGHTQYLYIAEMSNPWTISSQRVVISTPTYSFETMDTYQDINEGPQILNHSGKNYLIYSCNGGSSVDYNLN